MGGRGDRSRRWVVDRTFSFRGHVHDLSLKGEKLLFLGDQDEYPLVDEPLILAILADYSPDSFYASLPSVQEDLGMLQASAVPDIDQDDTSAYPPAPSSSSQSIDPTANADRGGITANEVQRPFSGSSRTSSSSSSYRSQHEAMEPSPPVLARDFASSAHVKRYKTKRARAPITILPRPSGLRKTSSFNSRAQRRSSVGHEASLDGSSHTNVSPEADGPEASGSTAQAEKADAEGIFSSDIPHLTDAPLKTFLEIAPRTTLVEANPALVEADLTASDTQESETETGLTTDETDDDLIPESAFDPLSFLKELFASVLVSRSSQPSHLLIEPVARRVRLRRFTKRPKRRGETNLKRLLKRC